MKTATTPPTQALANLAWREIIASLEQRAETAPGRDAVRALAPLDDVEAVRASLANIEALGRLTADRGKLPLGGVHPIGRLVDRARRDGALNIGELNDILSTQKAALATAAALDDFGHAPELAPIAAKVLPLRPLCGLLERSISPTGELSGAMYPELDTLRNEMSRRRETIHRSLETLLHDPALHPHLQERIHSIRGSRYVLPIKTEAQRHLPGIVHDVSSSGATLFVEPRQVIEETNALTLAEKALQRETERILRTLSAAVGEAAEALDANVKWLGQVDRLQAQALLAADYGGAVPAVACEGVVDIKGLAHPLMLLAGQKVQRNDVALGPTQRCMIISGANTGGKTVLLTSIGLCAALVQHGMPAPVQHGSRVDYFERIYVDIGDQQSLSESLSTFSAQVTFLSGLLAHAKSGHLVLIDEILTGTEPREGAALAAAAVEMLIERGATVFATTHYGDLKQLAAANPLVCNASVSFDAQRLQPTYRLVQGLPGASFAFPIARRHGIGDELVALAEQRLSGRPEAVESLLAQLHQEAKVLEDRRADVARQERTQNSRAKTLQARERAIADRERRVRQSERGRISLEFREAKRKIAKVIGELQSANNLPFAGKARKRIEELEQELVPPIQARTGAAPALTPQKLAALATGSSLRIISLDRVGTLAQVLDEGARARIGLGSLTIVAEVSDVAQHEPAAEQSSANRNFRKRPGGNSHRPAGAPADNTERERVIGSVFSHSENTVDLRGQRLEEAVEQAGRFFDLCVMKHVSPVVVIHGHGTGRLRTGLRSHFEESPYVEGYRPGNHGEGMDGVTVVALNL